MTRRIHKLALGGAAAFALLAGAGFTYAQQAAAPAAPAGGPAAAAAPGAPGAGGARRGGFSLNKPPIDFSDNTGWQQIFNGHDLTGWDGDPNYWTVKDNAIYAESTCEKPTGTVYIDWTGGTVTDFDLKFEMRGTGTANGGAQYRSWLYGTPGKPTQPAAAPAGARAGGAGGAGRGGAGRAGGAGGPGAGGPGAGGNVAAGAGRGPGAPGAGPGGAAGAGRAAAPARAPACANPGTAPDRSTQNKWYMDGPQYDFDNGANYPGQYYEQGTSRGIAAAPGAWVIAEPDQPLQQVAQIAPIDEVKTWWKKDDWNQALIVVRGHTYAHYLNGHLTALFTDDDPKFYQASGMIGFEIENTGSMEMRNIYLRKH